ncbi:MAG TPA: DUF3536 domain-containing protein [Terriglobales bacterium]|nr:DUF3536 domain-containing protein [Terriglobales bacterium]
MERYVCIHCHFYQPPRENPWLEAVELQDSAYPYHDWNERITAECYAPNGASRVLDSEGRIVKIVNNYARISFNFGPTLLSWLEENAPRVYDAILEADRESAQQFSGHGSALAQPYNHMILPLANRADKYTQIQWGVRDFEHRFRRRPEGMWLPEAGVDTETLDMVSDFGITFVVLAPRQAGQVRKLGARAWREDEPVDPTRAYLMRLPSGRSLNLFFYDSPISQAVAFEGLLANGETFAKRLLSGFSDTRDWPQLLHIATDGETYGHHHKYGDMALAFALDYIESNNLARLTNYGEYLAKHPSTHEAGIKENSSWSCVHGVERWRSDCGCNTGGRADWNQQWRAPLRAALDWLREQLNPKYEEKARSLLKDPWAARNDYINVVLDRSPESLNRFLLKHAHLGEIPAIVGESYDPLPYEKKVTILKLLELERHLMLMYTSCGWFFDELSGIETVQVIMYAGRAVQLAQDLFGDQIEQGFLERLALAKSNIPEQKDGAEIYRNLVEPAAIDLPKVGAHYVISSLFERYGEQASIYCYSVDRSDHRLFESGRARLVLGRARVCSNITLECAELMFGALHFGDHNLNAAVRHFRDQDAFENTVRECSEAFLSADLPQAIRALDRQFEGITYSLKSLFRDEQRRVVSAILDSTLAEVETSLRQLYERHSPLMSFLSDLGTPMPKVLNLTAEFAINSGLRRALEEPDLDLERIRVLLDVAAREKVPLDNAGLSFALKCTLEGMMEQFLAQADDIVLLEKLVSVVILRSLPFEVSLWKVQNLYWEMLREVRPVFQARDDAQSREWLAHFDSLGEKLKIRVPQAKPTEVPTAA